MPRLLDGFRVVDRQPHHLQAVSQRSKRISQLVGEQGQKFVLTAVFLFTGSDVAGNLGRADDFSLGIANGRNGERHVEPRAVLANPHRFEVVDVLALLDLVHDRREPRRDGPAGRAVPAVGRRSLCPCSHTVARPAVPTRNAAFEIVANDGVVRRFDDCGQVITGLHRPPRLRHVAEDEHRPANGPALAVNRRAQNLR